MYKTHSSHAFTFITVVVISFFSALSFDQKTALLSNLNAGKRTLKIIQLYWDLFCFLKSPDVEIGYSTVRF